MSTNTWISFKVGQLVDEGRSADDLRDYAEAILDRAEEIDTQTLKERSGSFIDDLGETLAEIQYDSDNMKGATP